MTKKKKRANPNRTSAAFADAVLQLYLQGNTADQIAEKTGRTREAVRMVQRTASFRAHVDSARDEWTQQTKLVLERLGMMAAATFAAGMSKNGTSRIAVDCADSVLDRVGVPRARHSVGESSVAISNGIPQGEGIAELVAKAKAVLAQKKQR